MTLPKLGDRFAREGDGRTWRVMSVGEGGGFVTLRSEDAAAVVWNVPIEDVARKLLPIAERPS